jgi:hypothetical protein
VLSIPFSFVLWGKVPDDGHPTNGTNGSHAHGINGTLLLGGDNAGGHNLW